MHGNLIKTKLDTIFNKEIIFSSCLWKKVVEKIINESAEKANLEKQELKEIQIENFNLNELYENKKQECLKLTETIFSMEKSRNELFNAELLKYKEKVLIFIFCKIK